jgi:propionyl-CoA carboxylase alpha chain
MPPQSVSLRHGDEVLVIRYHFRRDGAVTLVGGEGGGDHGLARIHNWRVDGIDIEIDGRRSDVRVTDDGARIHVQSLHGTLTFDVLPRFTPPAGDDIGGGGLSAPMPGAVLDVRCAVGDSVAARQVLVVLEAMKMEHHVSAPFDGVVSEVRVQIGDQVQSGAVLLVIEAHIGGDL